MKSKTLFLSLFTLLIACPTPPENVTNGGQNGNQPSPQGPPPKDAPQNNAPPQGDAQPQGDADANKDGEQPQGDADANKDGEQPQQQNGPSADVQQPPQVPDSNKPPEGGIITQSLLMKVNKIPETPIKAKHSQEDLQKQDHVTFTGTITCNQCTENLNLRATQFVGNTNAPPEMDLLTTKTVTAGEFSLLIPSGKKGVTLELLVDADNSGAPSVGERFAVVEHGGQLIPSENKSGLQIDASDGKIEKAAPVPNGAPEK